MVGISINSVEAKTNTRRNSTNTLSNSSSSSSTKTSVNDNYTVTDKDIENLKYNIFDRSSKNKLYRGISNEAIKLFNENTYPYFDANRDKFVTCFREDLVIDVKIKGEYLLNNSNYQYSCYDNVTEIFIPESVSSSEIMALIYKRNGDFSSDSLWDSTNLQIKDFSSFISSNTLTNIKETCDFKSYYSEIKNLLIASVATSGVATAAGVTSTVLKAFDDIKEAKDTENKDNKEKTATDKKLSGMNIAEIALSGTAAATSMTSAITNFVSIEKINKLSSQMEKCVDASGTLKRELQSIREEIEDNNGVLNTYERIVYECSSLSSQDKNIKNIKSLATASGITSMVGATASGASIATNIIGNTSDKVDGSKMNLASTITSGIGAVGGAGGTAMSAANLTKIQDLISSLENCTDSISELDK